MNSSFKLILPKKPDPENLPMSANEISTLARRFACSNPHDAAEQQELLDALCSIRKTLDPARDRAVCELLDGALLLTSYMTRMGHVGGPHVLGIIARLLETATEGRAEFAPPSAESQVAVLPPEAPTPVVAPGTASPGTLTVLRNMLLGEILIQRGVIRPEQIVEALRHQRLNGTRLGETLVILGMASAEQVQDALAYQSSARQVVDQFGWRNEHPQAQTSKPPPGFRKLRALPKEGSEAGPLRLMSDVLLGEVLVRNGTVTKAQLDEALKTQRAMGLRIGEALVRSGAVTKLQLECALQLQHKMRKRA